jgi:ABC-type uncharacterized transport system substrate-binding protein
MLRTLKSLGLGLALIAATSAVLLLSDLDRRGRRTAPSPAAARLPRIAIMQFASSALLDDATAGILAGLLAGGYEDGRTARLRRFNASGDYATANTMARDIAAGGYDLIITASTPALQVMAAANRDGKTVHVFGAVTDPYGSGVGITGPEPGQHPRHLVGIGTFQPVARAFALARQMAPGLRRVGVVWNPTEHNSEVCVKAARAQCRVLGLDLVEATVGNTSEVPEAVRAVLSRNVDALWVGGDTVATASITTLISTARGAHVPVFTNDPTDAARGALFGLGASYFAVGRTIGDLAVRVLRGADPRTFRVDNVVPERLALNDTVLAEFHATWTASDEARQLAASTAPPAPAATPAPTAQPALPPPPWNLRIVAYNETAMSEDCTRGLKDGLARGGLVEGRDFTLRVLNAQGDMVTLSSIMTSVRADQPDLLMTITTPALQAALRQSGGGRIVFTGVGDGVQAGAGRSESDHLPNVTGITTRSAFSGMAQVLREVLPGAHRAGTLFSPGEINSVLYKDWLAAALKSEGIELVAVPVTASAETADAAVALCRERIDAVCQIVDNTTRPGFAQIVRRAGDAGLPVFCFETNQLKDGAVLALARDYYQAGLEAGEIGVRVLRGASPATIPFANTRSEHLMVNPGAAARLGLTLPAGVLQRAEIFTPGKKP